ncbi:MAG: hypothetical protein V1773_01100 [bacterium]
MKDNLQNKQKNINILIGFSISIFFIMYGYELIQWALFGIYYAKEIQTDFYYIWFSTNLTVIKGNIFINLLLSISPLLICILLIELSNIDTINKYFNDLALLVFQLISLSYLLLKVITNAILPLVFETFTNDISVVLKYYQTSSSFKYLNVLFVVFVFIIYFNRLTVRMTKKVQNKKRGQSDKLKK